MLLLRRFKIHWVKDVHEGGNFGRIIWAVQNLDKIPLLKSYKYFMDGIAGSYIMIPVLTAYYTLNYLKSKDYLKLAWIVFSMFGLLLLFVSIFHDNVDRFYFENLFTSIAIVLVLPLGMDLYPKNKLWKNALAIGIILFGFIRVYSLHDDFSRRLEWKKTFLEKTDDLENNKIVIDKSLVADFDLSLTWGSAQEFWILSALKDGKQRSVIIAEDANSKNFLLDNKNVFIGQWRYYEHNKLPWRYFRFEKNKPYIRMNELPDSMRKNNRE